MDINDNNESVLSEGDSSKICPDCNKLVGQESASLTQWIFTRDTCVCNRPEFLDPSKDYLYDTLSSVAQICGGCGKRIVRETEGSLTQWIFKSHRCSCNSPIPIAPQINHIAGEATEAPEAPEAAEKIEIHIESLCTEEELETWLEKLIRYTPIKCLGKGAMGSVFMCFDSRLQKNVAVKCLNHSSDKMIVSFQNEAKAISNLDHRGIVKVNDFGIVDGDLPYMVMDYIDGVSLCDHIENNREIPIDTTTDLARKLAQSLQHAHDQKVLHRDIKSTNILISQDIKGELHPVLIDFGVAKLKHDSQNEQYDTLVGSASYMAPDYIESKNYTRQSEVYSLGIVLYECLTGDVPFLGENYIETVSMHLNNEIPSLSEARPDLEFTDDIEEIIRRCLCKDLSERFKSMKEIIEALDNLTLEPEAQREFEPEGESSRQADYIESNAEKSNLVFKYGALAFILLSITGLAIFISKSSLFTSQNIRDKPSLKSFDLNIAVLEENKNDPEIQKGKSYDYYYQTAKKLEKKRIPDKALKHINMAIKLEPKNADAYAMRALIYYQLMHFTGDDIKMSMAVSDLKKALELDPKNKVAYRYLAVWNIEEGNPEKGISILNKALKLFPGEPKFLRFRAIANESVKNYSAAIDDASRLVDLKPDYHANYKLRGQLYESVGDYEKALKDYSSAIERKSTDFSIYFLRGGTALKLDKFDIAIKDFDTIIKKNPNDGFAIRLRADAYLKTKQYNKALADVSKAIELNPNLTELYKTRSTIYEKMGDKKRSMTDRKKAIELKNRPAEKKIY